MRPALLAWTFLLKGLTKGEFHARQRTDVRRLHVVPGVGFDTLRQCRVQQLAATAPVSRQCFAAGELQLSPRAGDVAPAADGEGAVREVRLVPDGGIRVQAGIRLAPAMHQAVTAVCCG